MAKRALLLDMPAKRGVYLLPNLLTSAALFSGFYAVIAAMSSRFSSASIAVLLAMVLDNLDGRVARLTGTQTTFGMHYDSLSDMLAFGIAPALVMYSWSLSSLGKLGWLAAYCYTAATALRLARFGVSAAEEGDLRFFAGLPSPLAAGVAVSLVWLCEEMGVAHPVAPVAIAALSVLLGLLMVSNFRYLSFKKIDFSGRVPFVFLTALIVLFAGIAMDPPIAFTLFFMLYAGHGPCLFLWRWMRTRRVRARRQKSQVSE